tara:strand:+ start:90 stop:485 length:396 start_codon:yes stop_codon:yes gene_type:complete
MFQNDRIKYASFYGMEIRDDDSVLFACTPVEFRRIHALCPTTLALEYSHTDLVVRLENGTQVMLEIVQCLLRNGRYEIKMAGHTFPLQFSQRTAECMHWTKKLVFACFPDIRVCDMYGGQPLSPAHGELHE